MQTQTIWQRLRAFIHKIKTVLNSIDLPKVPNHLWGFLSLLGIIMILSSGGNILRETMAFDQQNRDITWKLEAERRSIRDITQSDTTTLQQKTNAREYLAAIEKCEKEFKDQSEKTLHYHTWIALAVGALGTFLLVSYGIHNWTAMQKFQNDRAAAAEKRAEAEEGRRLRKEFREELDWAEARADRAEMRKRRGR